MDEGTEKHQEEIKDSESLYNRHKGLIFGINRPVKEKGYIIMGTTRNTSNHSSSHNRDEHNLSYHQARAMLLKILLSRPSSSILGAGTTDTLQRGNRRQHRGAARKVRTSRIIQVQCSVLLYVHRDQKDY